MTEQEKKILDMVENVPDHKIEELFRSMGIELDLSANTFDIETKSSTEMMFANIFGDYK